MKAFCVKLREKLVKALSPWNLIETVQAIDLDLRTLGKTGQPRGIRSVWGASVIQWPQIVFAFYKQQMSLSIGEQKNKNSARDNKKIIVINCGLLNK